MHNPCRVSDAISGATLLGIEPTEIFTGCWVGVDNLASEYAKKHGLKNTKLDLRTKTLPKEVDAIILITFKGVSQEEQWLVDTADILGMPIVVW